MSRSMLAAGLTRLSRQTIRLADAITPEAPKGRGLAARIIARDLLALRDAEDGVAVALPRPPHGAQLVDDSMVEPDQTPTLFVGLVLEFILPSGSVELFTSYASTVMGILITARVTGGDGLADFSAGRTRCNPRGHPTAMALRKMRGWRPAKRAPTNRLCRP